MQSLAALLLLTTAALVKQRQVRFGAAAVRYVGHWH